MLQLKAFPPPLLLLNLFLIYTVRLAYVITMPICLSRISKQWHQHANFDQTKQACVEQDFVLSKFLVLMWLGTGTGGGLL
jgi:hypothetical protein